MAKVNLHNPFSIPTQTSFSNDYYESNFYNEQEKRWNEANGTTFQQFQEQNNEVQQKATALHKVMDGAFGVLMAPLNAIEGLIAGTAKGIREATKTDNVGDIVTQPWKDTWQYVKAGFGNSPNNGFRMWEDVTGAYTQMDKLNPTLKAFIGLGTDLIGMVGLGAVGIPAAVSDGISSISDSISKASISALNNVEDPVTNSLVKRLYTIGGGYSTATASTEFPIINKTFTALWEAKNFTNKVFGFSKTMKNKTLSELSMSTGMANVSKRASIAFQEQATSDFNAVIKNFAKDDYNENEFDTLKVTKSNMDKYFTNNNWKFTDTEWKAIETKSIQKLSAKEQTVLIDKINHSLTWQKIIELEKNNTFSGNMADFLLPRFENTFKKDNHYYFLMNTKNADDIEALGLKQLVESLTNEKSIIHDLHVNNNTKVLNMSASQVKTIRKIADRLNNNSAFYNDYTIFNKINIEQSINKVQQQLIDHSTELDKFLASMKDLEFIPKNIVKESDAMKNSLQDLSNFSAQDLTDLSKVNEANSFSIDVLKKLQDPNAILNQNELTYLRNKFLKRDLGKAIEKAIPDYQKFMDKNFFNYVAPKTEINESYNAISSKEKISKLDQQNSIVIKKVNYLNKQSALYKQNITQIDGVNKEIDNLTKEKETIEANVSDKYPSVDKGLKTTNDKIIQLDKKINTLIERNEKHQDFFNKSKTTTSKQYLDKKAKFASNKIQIEKLQTEKEGLQKEITDLTKVNEEIKNVDRKIANEKSKITTLENRNTKIEQNISGVKNLSKFYNESTKNINDLLEYYYLNKLMKDTTIDLPTYERNFVSSNSWLNKNVRLTQHAKSSMLNHIGEDLRLDPTHLQDLGYLNHSLSAEGKSWLVSRKDIDYADQVMYNTTKHIITTPRKLTGTLFDNEIALGFNQIASEELVNGGWDINLDLNIQRTFSMQERQLRATSAFLSAMNNGEFTFITAGSDLKEMAFKNVRNLQTMNKKVLSIEEIKQLYNSSKELMSGEERAKWDDLWDSLTNPESEKYNLDNKILNPKRAVLVDEHLWDVIDEAINVNSSKNANLLKKTFRKILNFWKQWSVLNPGFYFRIFTGNIVNFSVVGNVKNVPRLLRNWTKVINHMKRFQIFMNDVGHRAIDDIMKNNKSQTSDFFQGQLSKLARTDQERESILFINKAYRNNLINFGGTSRTNTAENYMQFGLSAKLSKGKIKQPLATIMNYGHRGVSYIDDGFKMAVSMLYEENDKLRRTVLSGLGRALEKEGLTKEQVAARLTKRTNFDYSELSKTEFTIVRNIIPFYTWMKNNLSLWWNALKIPGVSNVVNDLINFPINSNLSKYESASDLENHYIPIHLGGKIVIVKMHLPFDDIKTIFSPDALSRLNPMISMIYNAYTGQDLASGYQSTMLGTFVPTDFRNAINDGLYGLGLSNLQTKLLGYPSKSFLQSNSIFKIEDAEAQYEKNINEYNYLVEKTYTGYKKYAYDEFSSVLKRELTTPKINPSRKITDRNIFE